MARVLKGFHSFTCTRTFSSAIGMSHTCTCLWRIQIHYMYTYMCTLHCMSHKPLKSIHGERIEMKICTGVRSRGHHHVHQVQIWKISRTLMLLGSKFVLSHWLCTLALPQCSATASAAYDELSTSSNEHPRWRQSWIRHVRLCWRRQSQPNLSNSIFVANLYRAI